MTPSPDKVVFSCVRGSHMYGTNHADSDVDRLHIYVETADQCVGVSANGENPHTQAEDEDDVQWWTLRHFLQL